MMILPGDCRPMTSLLHHITIVTTLYTRVEDVSLLSDIRLSYTGLNSILCVPGGGPHSIFFANIISSQ